MLESLVKFPGGQSNPTYGVDTAGKSYVLRRKLFGQLLPSAHAVEREFRLMSALHPTGFPTPAPIALCDDATVIGTTFYLMELVEGRTFWDGSLPGLQLAERRRSEEHTSELQSLMRISYAVFCLQKKPLSAQQTSEKQALTTNKE